MVSWQDIGRLKAELARFIEVYTLSQIRIALPEAKTRLKFTQTSNCHDRSSS